MISASTLHKAYESNFFTTVYITQEGNIRDTKLLYIFIVEAAQGI